MTFRTIIAAGLLAFAALTIPATAIAADGYMKSAGILRAGPSAEYPRLARLKRGQTVFINGCLRSGRWCNITSARRRGWIQASRLATFRQGRRMDRFDPRQLLSLSFMIFGQNRFEGQPLRLETPPPRRPVQQLPRIPRGDPLNLREPARSRRSQEN